MKTKPIHFAICGAGHIGQRHAEMIKRNPDAALTAFIDTNLLTKEHLHTLYPEVPFFSSEIEFYKTAIQTDVLVVATPNGLHAEQALLAVKNGLHVVIEKPMALFPEDCKRIMDLAEATGRKVFCVMQNRYSPPAKWLKEIATNGTLGKIYQVNVCCFWNRDNRYYTKESWHGNRQLDGGTLFTQFSHFVDLIYWIFGDISHIQAHFDDFNHADLTEFEDTGNVIFRFVNGGIGSIQYSTALWDRNFESSITVIAENGTVKIGGQYMDRVEYCHINNYRMPELPPTNPPNQYGQYSGSAANHQFVIQNVVDVLLHQQDITTNASEGMRVVEIIRDIYQLKKTFKSG